MDTNLHGTFITTGQTFDSSPRSPRTVIETAAANKKKKIKATKKNYRRKKQTKKIKNKKKFIRKLRR